MSDDKNDRPNDEQLKAAEVMQRVSDAILSAALTLCEDIRRDSGAEDVFFVPVIQLHAVSMEKLLMGSVVHFQAGHDIHEIARLMRLAADHLEGCGPADHHVVREYLQ